MEPYICFLISAGFQLPLPDLCISTFPDTIRVKSARREIRIPALSVIFNIALLMKVVNWNLDKTKRIQQKSAEKEGIIPPFFHLHVCILSVKTEKPP